MKTLFMDVVTLLLGVLLGGVLMYADPLGGLAQAQTLPGASLAACDAHMREADKGPYTQPDMARAALAQACYLRLLVTK